MNLDWILRKDPRRGVAPEGMPCPVHDTARVPRGAGVRRVAGSGAGAGGVADGGIADGGIAGGGVAGGGSDAVGHAGSAGRSDSAEAAAAEPEADGPGEELRLAATARNLAERVSAGRMSVVRSDLPLERVDEVLARRAGSGSADPGAIGRDGGERCCVLLCTGCDSFVALSTGDAESGPFITRVSGDYLREHPFHPGPGFVDVLPAVPVRVAT